jgi:hypothetical protein
MVMGGFGAATYFFSQLFADAPKYFGVFFLYTFREDLNILSKKRPSLRGFDILPR